MSAPTDGIDMMIDEIAVNVRDALRVLRLRPGKQGGRKVIVHIDHNWRSALIELPPEVIQIRQE